MFDEQVLPDSTDFKSILSKAGAKGTKAIILCLFPGGTASFAKQNKLLGLQADLIGIELFEDQNEVNAAQGGLLGQWYVNADLAAPWFLDLYREKYNEYPGWAAANAYDSLALIAAAFSSEGADNRAIARRLGSLKDYSGASGPYSATGDHRFSLPAAIKVVRESGFERLW